ncbi:MAG: DUF4388 domain-containing protein [Burkholderiales bacterium]
MAFQGSLAELHLPDIIQLVSVSGKSGVFRLIDGEHRGDIWLQEGRIVHAEHEDLSGEEAVYALAIWRTGEFRFEAGVDSPRQTITKSNTNLLMEAARRLDEWRVLSKKIPSVDLVPEFVILENREGQINLNTMEWLLLSKIDGQRSVKQIAGAAEMGVFDAAKLLYGLVATNLIRLRQGGAPQQPATAPAPQRTASQAVAQATLATMPSIHPPQPTPTPRPTPTPNPAPAARPAPRPSLPTPAPTPTPSQLITRLGRLRDECVALLGPVGESVVQKHYVRARADLERGAGPEVIDDAVQQIARAAAILKGSGVAEAILKLLKS